MRSITHFGGIITLLSPPTAIPVTPKSNPLIHSPLPNLKLNGFPEVFLSKTLPFFNLPIYLIPTLAPDLAVAPEPIFLSSVITPPNKVLVGNFSFYRHHLHWGFLLSLVGVAFLLSFSTNVEPVGPCSNSFEN